MMNKKGQAVEAFFGIFVVVAIIAIIFVANGLDRVPIGNIGVMDRFGVVKGTMEPGWKWTGLGTQVTKYSLQLRQNVIKLEGDQNAVDKSGQKVFATIEYTYRFNPMDVEDVYINIGSDKVLESKLRLEGVVKEGFKTVVSNHASTDLYENREVIKSEAIIAIQANFPQDVFTLENVIISNLRYSEAFQEALDSKNQAEANADAEESKVRLAAATADIAIEDARGIAESNLLLAKAEAEGLALKSSKLTDNMVKNNWIDAWNGQLPQYMLGQDTNLLMSMD